MIQNEKNTIRNEKTLFAQHYLVNTLLSFALSGVDACDSEAQVECLSRFVKSMDESVKQLSGMMERSAKKYEECEHALCYL